MRLGEWAWPLVERACLNEGRGWLGWGEERGAWSGAWRRCRGRPGRSLGGAHRGTGVVSGLRAVHAGRAAAAAAAAGA